MLETCRGIQQTYHKNKNLCIKLVNYYDYTEMHGQHSIKIRMFSTEFRKVLECHTKFNENPSSWGRFVPCGQTDDGQVDMRKLIVALGNVANAPTFRTAIYQS